MDMPVLVNQQELILHQLCVDTGYSLKDLLGVIGMGGKTERDWESGKSVQSAELDEHVGLNSPTTVLWQECHWHEVTLKVWHAIKQRNWTKLSTSYTVLKKKKGSNLLFKILYFLMSDPWSSTEFVYSLFKFFRSLFSLLFEFITVE